MAVPAIGLVSSAFSFLGRKFDAMLFWLSLFATFYGQCLWLNLGLLQLMIPAPVFFNRLRTAGNYLVPISAFYAVAASVAFLAVIPARDLLLSLPSSFLLPLTS